MTQNLAQKLIAAHLVEGTMEPGQEIALAIDQTLTQDATGTLVMLECEAMGLDRVQTELSAQYVDHNLQESDSRNADDHVFLHSACEKFGIHYSPPGNGISHRVHMERFGAPGKTLLGSDSHTCAAGSLGMLAMGAGGIEVAMAMAGKPFYVQMPAIWGIELTGELPDWVSAKDVILEMLRRHGVRSGVGRIIEYHGPGLAHLSAMDRHVIANMGAELGATTSVFPADDEVESFLRCQGREADFSALAADEGAAYDVSDSIDLSTLEPLIACPSSPGNVVPVRDVAGRPIYQAMIGSSANPGLRDFAVPALVADGKHVPGNVSLDINPTSSQVLQNLVAGGYLDKLVRAGARIHQSGCNGCIGMGQAPATGKISLRTVPRNFPGRSGTHDDQVYLCSPETAIASALVGAITDPRDLGREYPAFHIAEDAGTKSSFILQSGGRGGELEKGPNIVALPPFEAMPDTLSGPVLLKTGDDISTDEILPAGSRVLPLRSNIPEISRFAFAEVDESFYERAKERDGEGFFVVAGENYGQGSSREHAALAPRYLGLKVVIAVNIARIHFQNLANYGVLPLEFTDRDDLDRIAQGDELTIEGAPDRLQQGTTVEVTNVTQDYRFETRHHLSPRQVEMVVQGGLMNVARQGEP